MTVDIRFTQAAASTTSVGPLFDTLWHTRLQQEKQPHVAVPAGATSARTIATASRRLSPLRSVVLTRMSTICSSFTLRRRD